MVESAKPFLWFNTEAEDAASFYTSIFDGQIHEISRWPAGLPYPAGGAMLVDFELLGTRYIAFNGGKAQKLTPAFSITVQCDTQAEIDRVWDALVEGGKPMQCGWLEDRFGLCWQIVPTHINQLIGVPSEGSARVMQAVMHMVKLNIADLEKAYHG